LQKFLGLLYNIDGILKYLSSPLMNEQNSTFEKTVLILLIEEGLLYNSFNLTTVKDEYRFPNFKELQDKYSIFLEYLSTVCYRFNKVGDFSISSTI
jgi:hypothetical protein